MVARANGCPGISYIRLPEMEAFILRSPYAKVIKESRAQTFAYRPPCSRRCSKNEPGFQRDRTSSKPG